MTNNHLFGVFFGAIIGIFSGSYICDVSAYGITGVMMIIIGLMLMVASAIVLVVKHFSKP